MRAGRTVFSSERGAAIVFVGVTLPALLGFLALGIDLGMLFAARTDAQRAADAAALAGASAFIDNASGNAVAPAQARAMEYARRNTFRNGPIDSSEITVTVIPESSKVAVLVRRDSVRTWLGWVFGIRTVPISAYAAAVASSAGAGKCIRPFAVPDIWDDANGDQNGNRIWDQGEVWRLGDDPEDFYQKFSGPDGGTGETGYGSAWRNPPFSGFVGDYGREIMIKVTDPNDVQQLQPGVFLPWTLPVDTSMADCKGSFSGGGPGASAYRSNICSCNHSSISLGTEYELKTGNMVGPTWQGVNELIQQDPDAYWDPTTNTVQGSAWGSDWFNSPRVIKVALFDPTQITGPGQQTIKFNNFAVFFLDEQRRSQDPVTGRFLYYASGSPTSGPQTGSLVRALRLVQ
ncbi:MAG TPA: pilus assembly protein TadG-related protein [Gemmatimonadales bacterium]|nr:pilus assembly protein TadG-related protein [Gemmatimonadales bacterium]